MPLCVPLLPLLPMLLCTLHHIKLLLCSKLAHCRAVLADAFD